MWPIILAIAAALFVFGGYAKFLFFTDKTIYIIIGAIILLILLRNKRK